MDKIFKALADPTRREMLDCLRDKQGITLSELVSRAAQDFLRGDIYYMPVGEVRQHDSILLEKLETLAVEHPELLQAVRDYHQLKTAYEAEREERFENSFFVR